MMIWMIQEDPVKAEAPDSPREIDILISKVAAGDEPSFHKLYDLVRGAVYGFALSIVKHPSDAEDILQETFLSIYQSAIAYKTQGKPMAWIMRIARNHALMKLRDRKRHQAMSMDEMESWLVGHTDIGVEDRLVLEAAMKVLTDEERQIISLHSLGGLKHREISDLMGIKLATVLSKYHRALKKLREALEGGAS